MTNNVSSQRQEITRKDSVSLPSDSTDRETKQEEMRCDAIQHAPTVGEKPDQADHGKYPNDNDEFHVIIEIKAHEPDAEAPWLKIVDVQRRESVIHSRSRSAQNSSIKGALEPKNQRRTHALNCCVCMRERGPPGFVYSYILPS